MDLSLYYKKLQSVYDFSIIVLFFTLCAVLFIGIRAIRDKNETVKEKILSCVLLTVIFSLVISIFFLGPFAYKKDIDEKTIYYYEGSFDIVKTTNKIYNKATFLFENKELDLKFFESADYEFDLIKPGSYQGKLVYAQNAAELLYIEIYHLE